VSANDKKCKCKITKELTWSTHINTVVKKAQQCLFPLRRLKRFVTGLQILKKFYNCTIESILTGCVTAWYGNCLASNHKVLQRVVCTTTLIIGAILPAIEDLYTRRCQRKALKIVKEFSPPIQTVLFPTAQQAVPMHRVWNQQDPEQASTPKTFNQIATRTTYMDPLCTNLTHHIC
jgi:hypothetical protein